MYLHKLESRDERGRHMRDVFYLCDVPMNKYQLEAVSDGMSYLGAREFRENLAQVMCLDWVMGFESSDTVFDWYQYEHGLLEDILERNKDLIKQIKGNCN